MLVGLHVSWPSVAGVSLALDKSESVSRLDMRSSSAWTSLRPSFDPAAGVGGYTRTHELVLYFSKSQHKSRLTSAANKTEVDFQQ